MGIKLLALLVLVNVAWAQQHGYEGYHVKVTKTMVNGNGVRILETKIDKGKARDGVRYFTFSCNAEDQHCFAPQKKQAYVIGVAGGNGIYKCTGRSNYTLTEEGSGQLMVTCLDIAY